MIISASKAAQAADILGLELEGLTMDAVKASYRAKAKACHPDGGNHDPKLWSEISWAQECLTRWLNASVQRVEAEKLATGTCRACGGSGRVEVSRKRGFGKALTVQCVMCAGSGEAATGGSRSTFSRGE